MSNNFKYEEREMRIKEYRGYTSPSRMQAKLAREKIESRPIVVE